MKNLMTKTLLALGLVAALVGNVMAADTSTTGVVRKFNTGVGTKPVSGYVKATVTSSAVSAGAMSVDQPSGTTPIAAWTANVRDSSGRLSFPAIVYSSPTFYVSSSGATSGTLVSGSEVTISIQYDRTQ